MITRLKVRAPAKINLFLRVTGRRADGYHELDSLFVPLALCDELELTLAPASVSSVELRCDAPGLGPAERNLAVRAAGAFLDEFGPAAAITIALRKSIPAGAGLGGGSSDAGAVLRMLARHARIDDHARLAATALRLGADVPFFLAPAPARVRGIGERIAPLPGFTALALVLVVPPIIVPTAEVFRRLGPADWSGPATDDAVRALSAGRVSPELLVNDLAPVAIRQWPVIGELKRALEGCGAAGAAMSGSGGAVFGVFATAAHAARAAEELNRRYSAARVVATTTLTGI